MIPYYTKDKVKNIKITLEITDQKGEKNMYKEKILKFASEQSIEVLTIENNEQKVIRR